MGKNQQIIENVILNGTPAEKRELFGFNNQTHKREIALKFKLFGRGLFARYFSSESAPFHDDMIFDMIGAYYGEPALIAGFRGCAKTALKKLFDAFILLNDQDHSRKYIKVLSKDGKNSQQIVTDVYNLIIEAIPVYGNVFEASGEFKREERMSSFTMASGVKYAAGTVGQTQRGHIQDAYRPDWCHEKGTMINDEGVWMRVEKHPSFKEYKKEFGKEIKLNTLPFSENVTFGHKYWAKKIIKNSKQKSEDVGDGWVDARDLTKKHYIGHKIDMSVKMPPLLEEYCPKIDKRNSMGQVVSTKTGTRLVEENKFLDKEWWWFFGLFWGDGNLGGRSIAVTIADKDTEIFERVKALLSKYSIKWYTHHYKGKCFRLQFVDAKINRWLRTWYLGGNSQKCPPFWVEQIDLEYQKELIKGYVDADGWIDKTAESVRIASVSLGGLLSARRILARLGIPSAIRNTMEKQDKYYICGRKCKTQKKYDLRFRENAKRLGYNVENQKRYAYPTVFVQDGYLWSKVEWAQDTKEEKLFCPITTEKHTYQTHFGTSHNCWFEDIEDRESIRSMPITRSIIDKCGEALDGLSRDGSYLVTCNYISDQGTVQWFLKKSAIKTRIIPILSNPDDLNSATWKVYTPEKIAKLRADADDWWGEYMCDPMRADNKFFDADLCDAMIAKATKPINVSAGVKYWATYQPHHRYGQGSDHSEGVGLDSNTLVGFDFTKGEQIYSYANNKIAPDLSAHEFARVGSEFGFCIYAPEINNKCGGTVITTLKQLKYPNLFRAVTENKAQVKPTNKLGWETNSSTKYMAFFEFRRDFNDGLIKINDPDILREMKAYSNADLNEEKIGLVTRHFDLLTACFVKGTMVLTDRGQRAIETIKVGDRVMTREGYKKIVKTCNRYKNVISNIGLTGTPDHPVFCNENEIKNLSHINNGDKLYIWNPKTQKIERRSFITAQPTIGIQMPHKGITERISWVGQSGRRLLSICIGKFGKIISGKFLMDLSSIIKTATRLTISLKTLKCCLSENICGYICRRGGEKTCLGNESIETDKKSMKQSGSIAKTKSRTASLAWFVKAVLKRFHTMPSFVPTFASLSMDIEKNGSLKAKGVALSANKAFGQVAQTKNIVRKNVLDSEEESTYQKVYNLEVADCPEYVANNVLVHNCVIAWQMRKYATEPQKQAMKSYTAAYDKYLENLG